MTELACRLDTGVMTLGFRFERDLVDALIPGLERALRPSLGLLMAAEVTNRARVVDLVLADTAHPSAVLDDMEVYAPGFRKLDGRRASLLAIIWRERRISLDRLSQITWTTTDRLRPDIQEMSRVGLVDINRRETLRPTGWAEWSPGSLIAVEAKLADWRGALSQATDHLAWADYSYVAMPSDGPLTNEHVIRALRNEGVGGLLVDSSSEVVVRPRARRFPKRGFARERVSIDLLGDLLLGENRWNAAGVA